MCRHNFYVPIKRSGLFHVVQFTDEGQSEGENFIGLFFIFMYRTHVARKRLLDVMLNLFPYTM